MKKKGLVLLLFFYSVLSCSAPPTTEDINTTKTIFDEYKTYTKINDKLKLSSTHQNKFVFTYINNKSLESLKNKKYPYTDGSIILKEAHGTNSETSPIENFFIMKKILSSDIANSDWYYAVTDEKGKPMQAGGKIQMCINCHKGAKDKDYVFGFDK